MVFRCFYPQISSRLISAEQTNAFLLLFLTLPLPQVPYCHSLSCLSPFISRYLVFPLLSLAVLSFPFYHSLSCLSPFITRCLVFPLLSVAVLSFPFYHSLSCLSPIITRYLVFALLSLAILSLPFYHSLSCLSPIITHSVCSPHSCCGITTDTSLSARLMASLFAPHWITFGGVDP